MSQNKTKKTKLSQKEINILDIVEVTLSKPISCTTFSFCGSSAFLYSNYISLSKSAYHIITSRTL